MTIVSIFRGGDFGNLAGWYSYFFGTIIRHTRVGFNDAFNTIYISVKGVLHTAVLFRLLTHKLKRYQRKGLSEWQAQKYKGKRTI